MLSDFKVSKSESDFSLVNLKHDFQFQSNTLDYETNIKLIEQTSLLLFYEKRKIITRSFTIQYATDNPITETIDYQLNQGLFSQIDENLENVLIQSRYKSYFKNNRVEPIIDYKCKISDELFFLVELIAEYPDILKTNSDELLPFSFDLRISDCLINPIGTYMEEKEHSIEIRLDNTEIKIKANGKMNLPFSTYHLYQNLRTAQRELQ